MLAFASIGVTFVKFTHVLPQTKYTMNEDKIPEVLKYSAAAEVQKWREKVFFSVYRFYMLLGILGACRTWLRPIFAFRISA